jgi:hypothetical protein
MQNVHVMIGEYHKIFCTVTVGFRPTILILLVFI